MNICYGQYETFNFEAFQGFIFHLHHETLEI